MFRGFVGFVSITILWYVVCSKRRICKEQLAHVLNCFAVILVRLKENIGVETLDNSDAQFAAFKIAMLVVPDESDIWMSSKQRTLPIRESATCD